MKATLVRADNPGPMTLDGTNTWVLDDGVVVDPGPDDPAHLDAVAAAAGDVALVLLTHRHPDHSESAAAFARRGGAALRAVDPAFCAGAEPLRDGERIGPIEVWQVPGHTSDSAAFLLDGQVLTGDTVLGAGSSVIAEPDGDLAAYLDSLRRLATLDGWTVLPGHGPQRADCAVAAREYLAHRRERLDQVRAALHRLGLAASDDAADAVVGVVYADVPERLRWAARSSVVAQLRYLSALGGPAAPDRG